MKKLKTAFILNIFLFILVLSAVIWMMNGPRNSPLSHNGWGMLRYFTVDSNILLGISALIMAIDEWKVLKGIKPEISVSSAMLKLTGTVSITLTILVTVFFLVPTTIEKFGPFALFSGSNFLFHLVIPILSIICFVCYEKTDKIPFRLSHLSLIPLLLYAVYYVVETLTHTKDGVIMPGYDWYGFFFRGVSSVVIVLPILILITWGISVALWKLNRR